MGRVNKILEPFASNIFIPFDKIIPLKNTNKRIFSGTPIRKEIKSIKIKNENIQSKCGWSPFNGQSFKASPVATIINGKIKMLNGKILGQPEGLPLDFN